MHRALHERLDHIEGLLATGVKRGVGATVAPAWRRPTAGESRWPVSLAK
jgi:hypothetical protein